MKNIKYWEEYLENGSEPLFKDDGHDFLVYKPNEDDPEYPTFYYMSILVEERLVLLTYVNAYNTYRFEYKNKLIDIESYDDGRIRLNDDWLLGVNDEKDFDLFCMEVAIANRRFKEGLTSRPKTHFQAMLSHFSPWERIEDYPAYEDLTGNPSLADSAEYLVEKVNPGLKKGLFGIKGYKLISIERRPEIYIVCGIMAEMRKIGEDAYTHLYTERFEGADPPHTKREFSDFNKWDLDGINLHIGITSYDERGCSNAIKETFRRSGHRYTPQKAIWAEDICDDCFGSGEGKCTCNNGKIVCPKCGGERIVCPSCHGSSGCSACGGKGTITESKTESVWEWDGTYEPDGTPNYGYKYRTFHNSYTCPACGGSGGYVCPNCMGRGYEICRVCDDEGVITCPECNGTNIGKCPSCYGNGEKLRSVFIWQDFKLLQVVAPVTGFRSRAGYNLNPENKPPIVPGEPLSSRKIFFEDKEVGSKFEHGEPKEFMGVDLGPYFDYIKQAMPENDDLHYQHYRVAAYMRDCLFIKYTLMGAERELCFFPDYGCVMCDLRHPQYHELTKICEPWLSTWSTFDRSKKP